MVKVFEYEFGVFVRAESASEAWEKVRAISEKLDAIDYNGESTIDGPYELELDN